MDKLNKKCPFCGTVNKSSAKTCASCGSIFEDNLVSSVLEFPQTTSNAQTIISKGDKTYQETITSRSAPAETSEETTLKEEHNVFCRSSLVLIEGDLTLTNKRLLFVSSKGRPPVTEPEDLVPESTKVVEDDEDPENPPDQGSQSFSIPLSSIVNVEGKRGMLRPSLTVYWRDDSQNPTAKMEFIQKTRRVSSSENINEWGSEILRISFADISLTQKKNSDLEAVDQESVASKILGILDADEWKGLFQIKKELREEYDTDIDIDELETQCNKLVTEKLVERDEIGEFYRKLIPSNSEQ